MQHIFSEGRFTGPREDCPHPELWHSFDSDSTELEVTDLVAAFVSALKPEFVIETGSAFGQTSEAIGTALKNNGYGELVTLETSKDRAQTTADKCVDLPVRVLNMSSLEYTPERQIDFAWFDSLLELRANEFRRYLPYMSKRAVVGFHDTGPQHPTRSYIKPLQLENLLVETMYLPTPRGVCFSRVKGAI